MGTQVRVKLQLNHERRNFITPNNSRDNYFPQSISIQYMASCTIVLASFDDAAATSQN